QQKQTDSEVIAAKGGRRTGCAGGSVAACPTALLSGISRYVNHQRTQTLLAFAASFLGPLNRGSVRRAEPQTRAGRRALASRAVKACAAAKRVLLPGDEEGGS